MRTGHVTIIDMRIWSPRVFWGLVLTGFPLLATASGPCAPVPRIPGTPIDAPHAVFEAYVVDVSPPQSSPSAFGVQRMRRALVEVVRSYHGPYSPGQQVETLTIERANSCGGAIESGAHVMVGSESGGPFEIVATLLKGAPVPAGPFAALALTSEKQRHSARPSLKNASLRGEIDEAHAAHLYARARPGPLAHCEISGVDNFAQVTWGKAFGGNDARSKVIFERVDGGWVEILRYEAPAPTPARHRPRRAKQRALWAEESGLRRPAASSADSKS